jgi:NAD(P)-dependent dehydrogenase (short-subunit alcohol dehydrogenase family)
MLRVRLQWRRRRRLIRNTTSGVLAACFEGDEADALRAEAANPAGSYPAAKRAFCLWTRRAAVNPDWAGAGIPLNAIAPGPVLTPLFQPVLDNPERLRQMKLDSPMPLDNGRMATPEEIAHCSPISSAPRIRA